MAPESVVAERVLFLENLKVGVTGVIVLMFSRIWDVHASTGRYLSTDFIVCDSKGGTKHATARGTIVHNFLKLKQGGIYSVKNFVVNPNKDDFRVIRNDPFMLEFDGATTIRKAFNKPDGFIRYPFQLVEFEHLEITNNKYTIDAVGYVTNVGRTVTQKSGSKTLDFHLANFRGQSIRVTLWGSLGEKLIEKRTSHVGVYPIILTCLTVKLYNGRLYLSSTSLTLILDDDRIPHLKQLKPTPDAKAGTLENLLMWSRNRRHDHATFHCTVNIDNVRTKNGWNFPSCGGEKCKKQVTRSNGVFLCESSEKEVDYPVLRLKLEVSDDTAQDIVVMFNETATSLLKCMANSIMEYEDQEGDDHVPLPQALVNVIGTKHTLEFKTQTYFEHNTFESFTCWKIVTAEGMDESVTNSVGGASHGSMTLELKRASPHPAVITPSKAGESKRQRGEADDLDVELSFVADTRPSSGGGGSRSVTRKNKRHVVNESPEG